MTNPALPESQRRKLDRIIRSIESDKTHYSAFRGKKLARFDGIISVPLGMRWRALFRKTHHGIQFVACMSHENYNHMNFEHFQL
jgi:hypothetical protein